MIDLKSSNVDPAFDYEQNKPKNINIDIGDRSYYKNKLTDSVIYTRSSYVPTDTLF